MPVMTFGNPLPMARINAFRYFGLWIIFILIFCVYTQFSKVFKLLSKDILEGFSDWKGTVLDIDAFFTRKNQKIHSLTLHYV